MDLSFFPFAHENCLHFKVAPVINDKKTSKAPCFDRSSPCNTMNLRSSESSPQIAPLDETIKEMCLVGDASATDITEEAALARNAGSEPQLELSVFLCHSDDD